ncbi:hypothetical protein M8818_007246 [Zalaria obscura]|uniref:Uncharacterized protein n=1 Tax=Zalaria obscura TaxID=2024903 RepID=A0ACC3S4V1_9PEZI
MEPSVPTQFTNKGSGKKTAKSPYFSNSAFEGNFVEKDTFKTQPGTLTIVDLSDPFLDDSTACVLFDVCLTAFEQSRPASGLVVALDEAHKVSPLPPPNSTYN